jgi:hypothetical protein
MYVMVKDRKQDRAKQIENNNNIQEIEADDDLFAVEPENESDCDH